MAYRKNIKSIEKEIELLKDLTRDVNPPQDNILYKARLGQLYTDLGRKEETLQLYNSLRVDIEEAVIDSYLGLAREYLSEGKDKEAGDCLIEVLTLEPRNLEALELLSIVAEHEGDKKVANYLTLLCKNYKK